MRTFPVLRATRSRLAFLVLLLGMGVSAPAGAQQAAPDTARRVAAAEGFQTPESVRYDAGQDLYFVSNIAGGPSSRDGNGFISRVDPEGRVRELRFIQGGRGGVTLHAPKGMAIAGDTLWVTDIDALRAFHRRTGAPLATVELGAAGATFLNDLVVGPDGALYVTDTGIVIDEQGRTTRPGPGRIYRVAGGRAGVVAEGSSLATPNGIALHPGGHFLLAPAGGPALQRWQHTGGAPQALAAGPGGYDGVEVLADGRVLVTSWADSAVHVVAGAALVPVIRGVGSPADLGVDGRRGRVAVPLFLQNRVEIWTIPARTED